MRQLTLDEINHIAGSIRRTENHGDNFNLIELTLSFAFLGTALGLFYANPIFGAAIGAATGAGIGATIGIVGAKIAAKEL